MASRLRHFLKYILFCTVFFAGSISVAQAAVLYLDPPTGTYVRGDTFTVKVRLNNEDDCVNAVDARIGFPAETLKVVAIGTGSSILTLWTEKPTVDMEKGMILFSGGLPGGYCGRVAGDPGLTNTLVEIVFQTSGMSVGKKPADSGVLQFLPGSTVLRADGTGEPVTLTTKGSSFTISDIGTTVKDGWLEVVRADKTPPQPFSIEVSRNASVFGGGYFIAFSTSDKETGIEYYEVQESDIAREGMRVGTKQPSVWRRAESPYLLEDQTLNSTIRVRAVDKAGNERLAGFIPDESIRHFRMTPLSWLFVALGGVVLVVLLIVALLWWRRRKGNGLPPTTPPVTPPDSNPPTL